MEQIDDEPTNIAMSRPVVTNWWHLNTALVQEKHMCTKWEAFLIQSVKSSTMDSYQWMVVRGAMILLGDQNVYANILFFYYN